MEKKVDITEELIIESDDNEIINTDSHENSYHSHSSHHSHHHHHSHKHHHSSSKKSNKRKKQYRKEKFEQFIRHNKKYIAYCIVSIVVFMFMIFVGRYFDKIKTVNPQAESTDEYLSGIKTQVSHLQVDVPFFADEVVIVSPAVEAFMKSEPGTSVNDIYNIYKTADSRLDIGMPVEISYNVSMSPDGYNVKKAEVLVSDNEKFVNPSIFSLEGHETKVDVYNLKTGTKYYYRINLTFTNNVETSVSGNFITAEGPRVLFVDGVYNMRDIGGWKTVNGKTVKQGLLYRGCEIDGAVEPKYTITDRGINTMLRELGIKTDMDLRAESDNIYGTNVLGTGVKHNYYATNMYSTILNNEVSKENIRRVFSDLADKNNYPIYMHCTYGQDRTGTVCYLLESLLGVSEEDMMKDYLLSGLHHGDVYGGKEPMEEFVANLKKFPGISMSEKVEHYLISIGVTDKEINSIRSIFLGN